MLYIDDSSMNFYVMDNNLMPIYNIEVNFVFEIWPGIVKTLKSLGLEFHYFSFFNMNLDQSRVYWNY